MRVRNLLEKLQNLMVSGVSAETEVSLFTGWEGETFLTPENVIYLPSGIAPPHAPAR